MRALVAEPRVGLVVLAAPEGLEDAMAEVAAAESRGVPVVAVTGGATRAESVALALAVVPDEFEVALVHDAARCLVPGRGGVRGDRCGPGRGGSRWSPVPRSWTPSASWRPTAGHARSTGPSLRAVQTPQGFGTDVLRRAHAAGDPGATDDAGMVEALGLPVVLVPGHPRAFKVTTAQDLLLAEAILAGGAGSGAAGPWGAEAAEGDR